MATTTIVSHTYKLKRGKEDAILNANPLLLAGEPIVVFRNDGSTNIKIGDGVTYYRDLPWIGSDQIYCAKQRSSFPNIGNANVIYKAEETATLYQWNSSKLCYEPLGGSGSGGPVHAEDVLGLQDFVDARIDAKVDTQIDQAVDTKVETVVETLKTEFVTTETVTVIESQLTTIEKDVTTLQTDVKSNEAKVEEVKTELSAIDTDVQTVKQDITVIEQTVETKADTTRVEALETVVETKIDTEALEVAKTEMAANTAQQISELSTQIDVKLEEKADDADIDELQEQIDNLSSGVIESVGTVSGGTAEDLLASLS